MSHSNYHAGYGAANNQYNYGAYGNQSSERLTVNYHDVDQPGTPSKEYYPPNSPQPARRNGGGKKKWWVIGGIVAIAVIAAAVVGGVVGSHKSTSNATAASSGSGSTTGSNGGAASGGGGAGTASGNPTSQAFALPALDARGNPIYSDGTTASPSISAVASNVDCGADPWTPTGSTTGTGTGLQLRPGHPRLIAPAYRWQCLQQKLIPNNGYLRAWNATIFQNATDKLNAPPTTYVFDGGATGSGALDIARETQLRIKLWGYAYLMTNDTKWVNRAWQELQQMSGDGNAAGSAGAVGTKGDPWNSQHFLDVAEFTAAYAYAYDWMFAAWTPSQLTSIRNWILTNGLAKGTAAYAANAFWLKATGNWNCVNNNGLTAGALAIWDEDTTQASRNMVAQTIPNALTACAQAISSDGTWLETSDYFYFGITGHAALTSNLLSATGSDQGMLSVNPALNSTGLFHMYGTGFFEKFNWGDCGPNKFTATANALLLYGKQLANPLFSLYQRDRLDAPEPFSMHWYDFNANGNWWYNLPLDHYFNNVTDAWAAMRGSWTNVNAVYAAMKAGSPMNKQTHANLDAGTFVFEALGQRWAGELCQDDYLFPGYFSSEAQNSQRWQYYRCSTQGQNTIVLGNANQMVTMQPPTTFGSTNDVQSSLGWTAPSSSAAFFKADLTTAYGGTNIQRGMRLVAGRQAMLLQDEITGSRATAQWRVHTNATISMSADQRTANLALNGQQVAVTIRQPAAATFGTAQPAQASTNELGNPGITVLTINVAAGTNTIETLWTPQGTNVGNVPSVALSGWTTTSHN